MNWKTLALLLMVNSTGSAAKDRLSKIGGFTSFGGGPPDPPKPKLTIPQKTILKTTPEELFKGVLMRAEAGSTNAMTNLVALYRLGIGTQTNEFEARIWEIRAAGMGARK